MLGRSCGQVGKYHRYYATSIGFQGPATNTMILRKLIPADLLEREVLRVLGEVLKNSGTLPGVARTGERAQ